MSLTIDNNGPIQSVSPVILTTAGDLVGEITDDSGGTATDTLAASTLTVNTGGTPSSTLAAMTTTEPADLAAVGTQFVIIANSISSLGTNDNTLTDSVASLAAAYNAQNALIGEVLQWMLAQQLASI